jgi:hypothetical protein
MAWQMLLAISIKKRGFKMRVDDVAGNVWQAVRPGAAGRGSRRCG